MNNWNPSSWRDFPIKQQPTYNDLEKLKKVENVMMCGFPLSSIHKVMAKLEERKINYLIVDRRNNYEVDEISDNKNLNNYIKYFEKAKRYINYKDRDIIYPMIFKIIY